LKGKVMSTALSYLVVEGNTVDNREAHRRTYGLMPCDAYGETMLSLSPDGSRYDVCFPADEGANLLSATGLSDYDAIILTGSALHLWQGGDAVRRQIEFAREAFRSQTPILGSCWGLQVASAAAGGDVRKNTLGREVGFARNIALNDAGRSHPLLAGRPAAFDAPAIHLDIVTTPPAGATILASNALTPMQAAEIHHEGGSFWGIQYHPEFSLHEVAVILRRLAPSLVGEGFRRTDAEAQAYCDQLDELHRDPSRRDLAWALGLDDQVLDPHTRMTELRNFIENKAKPTKSMRGRA
jgi:GMP synthase (glutamine-hydrolysing)